MGRPHTRTRGKANVRPPAEHTAVGRGLGRFCPAAVAGACLLVACNGGSAPPTTGGPSAGGQTGEITRLGECEDSKPVGSIDDLEPDIQAKLEAAVGALSRPLTWELVEEAVPTTLQLTISADHELLAGMIVEEAGRGGCRRWVVPVTVQLETGDGRLDGSLIGVTELFPHDAASLVRASTRLSDLEGGIDLSFLGPMAEGSLYASFAHEKSGATGQLFISPEPTNGDEAADEVRIASF